jgi:hypothetical protein
VIDFLAENEFPPTAWTRPAEDQFDLERGDKCRASDRPDDNRVGPLNRGPVAPVPVVAVVPRVAHGHP